MTIRIGISGWRYAGWRGVFYPEDLRQRDELDYASRHVDTIEINGSHYSLQTVDSYRSWHDATPPGFVFAVKGPRYLTHWLRFRDGDKKDDKNGDNRAHVALANFFASGVLALGRKLGPFLWQFPPNFRFDPTAFEHFLAMLPQNLPAARTLARSHDGRVRDPWFAAEGSRRLRHAVEIRHDSFCDPAFTKLLRKYRAALVVSDAVAEWPYAEDVTSDFVYLRLHGSETLYGGAYSDRALDRWAARIEAWSHGREPEDAQRIETRATRPQRTTKTRDVYCYFDNDMKVKAPFDARRLMARIEEATGGGLRTEEPGEHSLDEHSPKEHSPDGDRPREDSPKPQSASPSRASRRSVRGAAPNVR